MKFKNWLVSEKFSEDAQNWVDKFNYMKSRFGKYTHQDLMHIISRDYHGGLKGFYHSLYGIKSKT